jgi:hypothetical protein
MTDTRREHPRADQPATPVSPFDDAWHLRAELGRVLEMLSSCLHRQRQRGRTPVGDAVGGLVIEEGEAEGLVADLASALGATPGTRMPPELGKLREDVASHAAQGVAQGVFLPLVHAQRAFELRPAEYDAVLLALAVEIDPRFGRLVAYLNDHVARTRPTLGLALTLADPGPTPPPAIGITDRPFLRDGLVDLEGDAPLPGKTIKLTQDLVDRLAESSTHLAVASWLTVHGTDQGLLDRLVLEPTVDHAVTTWSDSLRAGQPVAPLLIAGSDGNGRATLARAALLRAGLKVVEVEIIGDSVDARLRVARREARWHRAAVLVRARPTAQQAIDWASLWSALPSDRPIAISAAPDDAAAAGSSAPVEPALVRLDEPSIPTRTQLWTALLPPGVKIEESEIEEIASRFPFGPGRIARAIRRAQADLSLRPAGERRLTFAALMAAAREVDTASIGPLAQKMPLPYRRSDLIVPPHVGDELDLAIAWVRYRHRVLHEWGFIRRMTMGHGLTALFSGPSGTGKTMAAQVLARELALDLYRVDLSQIMSKYIGETEKNLATVYGARVGVLFFDEAEVVLGRRHETKDARDRYANIEIAYLLQRMEEYDGVTVLATNRMQDIDEAFMRRLHVVIDFSLPLEADRLRIWEGMLPEQADRAPDLDLRELAREFEVSGGQIKNAALAGAFLAAAAGEPIGTTHLRRAMRRELVKSGKIM